VSRALRVQVATADADDAAVQASSQGQIPLGLVARNFLVANVTSKLSTSYGLVTRKLSMSPTSPRGSYEEVNDVTRKLRGTGPSGVWPLLHDPRRRRRGAADETVAVTPVDHRRPSSRPYRCAYPDP